MMARGLRRWRAGVNMKGGGRLGSGTHWQSMVTRPYTSRLLAAGTLTRCFVISLFLSSALARAAMILQVPLLELNCSGVHCLLHARAMPNPDRFGLPPETRLAGPCDLHRLPLAMPFRVRTRHVVNGTIIKDVGRLLAQEVGCIWCHDDAQLRARICICGNLHCLIVACL